MKLSRSFLFLVAIVNAFAIKAQLTVDGVVKHATPTSTTSVGNITLNVSGGTAPYTYSWSPGGATTKDLNGVARNNYVVTVNDAGTLTATYPYSLGYKTKWMDCYAGNFRNDTLLSGYNVSKNTLLANADGWAEFVVPPLSASYQIGFSDSLSTYPNFFDTDFGVYVSGGYVYYVSGTYYGFVAYAAQGDVIRLERADTLFNLKINGVTINSERMSKTKNFKLHSLIYTEGLSNVGASFLDSTNIYFANYVRDYHHVKHCTPGSNNGSITLTPKINANTYLWSPGSATTSAITGLSLGTYATKAKDQNLNQSYHKYNIGYKTAWRDVLGSVVRNDSLLAGYSVSKNTLLANTDGWAEFVIPPLTASYFLGFADSLSAYANFYDVDFGIMVSGDYIYYISGTYYGIVATAIPGSVIRLERVDTLFNLKVDGVTIASEKMAKAKNYKLQATVYSQGIADIGASFTDSTNINFPYYLKDYAVIRHETPGLDNASISLTSKISGEIHTYTFSPGSSTVNPASALSAGVYTVTTKDADANTNPQFFNVGYKTSFNNKSGLIQRNDSVIWNGDESGISKNTLLSGQDGWAEIILTGSPHHFFMGFLDSAMMLNGYTDIDYGFYNQGNAYIYGVSNNALTSILLLYPQKGEAYRIERKDTMFYLKVNGSILYSTVMPKYKNYKLKISFGSNDTLRNIGTSFNDSTNISFPNYVRNKVHIKHSSGMYVNDGSIELIPKYGETGNVYYWTANGESTPNIYNQSKGAYNITVQDTLGNTSNYNYDILYKVNWTDLDSCSFRNDTVKTNYGYTNWSTAVGKNILKAGTNGEISWPGSIGGARIVGFADTLSGISGDFMDLDHCLYEYYGDVYYMYDGNYSYIYSYDEGDILKIKRSNDTVTCYVNDYVIYTATGADNSVEWRVKTVVNPGRYTNDVGCSFPYSESIVDVLKEDIREGYDSSGYISVQPRFGEMPHTYKWNTGSTENTISNLAVGNYSVTIKDANGDSVIVKRSIGFKAVFDERENTSMELDGFRKIYNDQRSVITLKNYLASSQDGSFEFKLIEKSGGFNALFREFDPPVSDSDFVAPIPLTITKIETVTITGSDIPSVGSVAFRKLNLVTTYTPNGSQPTSLDVWKTTFIDGTFDTLPQAFLDSQHGIVCIGGSVYFLSNGQTINKPVSINDNDILKLSRVGSAFKFYINGDEVESATLSSTKNLGFDINLTTPIIKTVDPNTTFTTVMPFIKGCSNSTSKNWTAERIFDGLGNVVSDSKQFLDDLGRPTQSLDKDMTKNNVLASQTIYDLFGRPVLQTLPAPTFQSQLCYFTNFINNTSGTAYTYNNFDKPNYTTNSTVLTAGEKDKPEAVQNSVKGSVGWYYSNYNNEEQYTPTATTPYNRVEYSISNPSSVLRTSKAGFGLDHGSGHEVYQFSMKTSGELYYFFGFLNSWKIKDMESHFNNYTACLPTTNVITEPYANMQETTTKNITRDENGNESVDFYDIMGNEIGSCLAGSVNGSNQEVQVLNDYIDASPGATFPFVDIHLPEGCQTTLILQQLSPTPVTYNIIDLKTERYIKFSGNIDYTGTTPNLPAGYYRIKIKTLPTLYQDKLKVKYSTNYYNFTANYYDRAGRLRLTVPPKGLDYNGGNITGTPLLNQTKSKVFGQNSTALTYATQGQNTTITPDWLLVSSSAFIDAFYHPVNNIGASGNTIINNFVVSFSGKTTAYELQFPGDNSSSAFRTIAAVDIPVCGNMATPIITIDSNDVEYKVPELNLVYNDTNSTNYNYVNGPCGYTVIPVVITYQLYDGYTSGGPVNSVSGVETITGYCTIKDCGTSYTRSWAFPPAKTHQVINAYTSGTDVIWLKVLDMHLVQTPNYATIPTGIYTDITSHFNVTSGIQAASPAHKMTEVFSYNSWGELLTNKKPDEGTTDYINSLDGKTRFVQNAKQDQVVTVATSQTGDKFSYVNYDEYDRPVERGEYVTGFTTGSAQNIQFQNLKEYITNGVPSGKLSVIDLASSNTNISETVRTKEKVFVVYDQADPNFTAQTGISTLNGLFSQRYLIGEISYSYNENKKTWFSYDELGRTKWVVQRYENIPDGANSFTIKSYYYNYDYMGNLTRLNYQWHLPYAQSNTDQADFDYAYDSDKRLVKSYSTIYNPYVTFPKLDAEYSYYLHGPLKRTQLGGGLQGIDYVYTINGALKNINSPEMDLSHDPGKDGGATSPTKVTYPDLFGMSLDYFNGDFLNANTYIQTYNDASTAYAPDLYNGSIKAHRWQTKTPTSASGMVYQNQHLIYGYKYDRKNQLLEANFGTITANSNQNSGASTITNPTTVFGTDYKVSNLSYDLNGNILTLKRNAYSASSGGLSMDDLTYSYTSCTNKLSSVSDAVTLNPYNNLGFGTGLYGSTYVQNVMGELEDDQNDNKSYEYNSDGQITKVKTYSGGTTIVEFKYDEAGQRILKTSYNGSSILNTFYVRDPGGQVIATSERAGTTGDYTLKEYNLYSRGRIGTVYRSGSNIEYVYELNDHLGNARTTFNEQLKQSASIDFNTSTDDDIYFTDQNSSLYTLPSFNNVSRVYSPNKIVGATSKYISGNYQDAITADVYVSYAGSTLPVGAQLVIDLLDESGVVYTSASVPVTSASQNNFDHISVSLTNVYFGYGFFKVYVKNTSTIPVDFDILTVTYTNGGIKTPNQLDVTNYYPHGSVLPGMNYQNTVGGRYGYQGQFAENDKEINETSFELRNYNPILGRFNTVDPEEQYHSPYMAMGNNHINEVDPDGGFSAAGMVFGATAGLAIAITDDIIYTNKHKEQTSFARFGGIIVVGALIGGGINVTHLPDGNFFGRSDGETDAYRVGFDLFNRALNGKKSGSFYYTVKFGKDKQPKRKKWVTVDEGRFSKKEKKTITLPNSEWRARALGGQGGEGEGPDPLNSTKIRLGSIFGWKYGQGRITYYGGKNGTGVYKVQHKIRVKPRWKEFGIKIEFHRGWKVRKR